LFGQLDRAIDAIPVGSVQYKILALIALGGLFNTIEQFNVSYAGPTLTRYFGISNGELGLLSTATFVAMAVGSAVAGYLSDRLGRKSLFMANIAIFTVGALLAALAPTYGVLVVARLLVGLGLGGELSLAYTVISEIMPTRRRGVMSGISNFVTGGIGTFAAAGLAFLVFGPFSDALGGPDLVWRWWFGLMVLPALLLIFYRRYIPETPRYLLERGDVAATNRVLTLLEAGKLRDVPEIATKEFLTVKPGAEPTGQKSKVGIGELFRRNVVRRTLVAWLLALALYTIAVNLTVFMPTVLVDRGLDISSSLAYTMITTFAGTVGAAIGIAVAHRIPRKLSLVMGGIAATLLGMAFFLTSNLALALTFAAAMMAISYLLVPVVVVYFTELFPTRIRGIGTGSSWFIGFVAAGLGSYVSGAIIDSFGNGGMFIFISAMCVLLAFAASVGPETFNRSIDDL